MPTLCGGYCELKTPSPESQNVLTTVYEDVQRLHEYLSDIKLNYLLDNHTYTTQVVAGLNYKFKFEYNGHTFIVVVWKKLDGTHVASLGEIV